MQALLAWALLLSAAPAGASKTSEAEHLFNKGRELMRANRASEACPLFEKSHQLDPALGTLLNLADCFEKTGQPAKAYLSFNEAAAWARRTREKTREETASARVSALKAKLSWLNISAPNPTPGLVVSVDTFRVELASTPISVPIDAGEWTVTANAPGRLEWSIRVKVAAMSTVSVQVPSLEPRAAQDAPVAAAPRARVPPGAAPAVPLVLEQPTEAAPYSVAGPVALWAVGGVAIVAGGVGLGWSYSTYGRFERQQPGQPEAATPTVTRQQFDTLRWVYPASWAALGVGVAAVGVGTVLYWSGKPVHASVAPAPGGGKVNLGGTF
ncbi:MAG: hypothetical protein K1X64_15725 [Myxococcaceae bacterium]|nr:hypothetical protein [Myxococcaceae bacterium]